MATAARACPKCAAEVRAEWSSCPFCAATLRSANSEVPTAAMPERRPPSSSTADEGRFPAGTMLGERYKIIGLLGRGGMGEVYRAADLKLEQQVALKFLPPQNTRLLERFRSEVRIARQVSHRNVCRVYDLGEIDGAPFISMEYVDGEDLGSLLRRIGRLPGDKAIEFARRLCAGLAAAHEKGVLHRDLKPANIMIDGRGQVLIMDFGLAAAADAIAGGDIRSGTPAYMAPEQKEAREVTVRSDIYSLGLVLQEMFLGRESTSSPKDLNPAVEKVIQRCLDPNPSKRPQSALDVSRALPGGDPLAEALAAGDTPSPEMVAASEDTDALTVRAAIVCAAVIVAGLAALVFWGSRYRDINLTPMPYSPDVLRQKVHETAARFGYTATTVDESHSFERDNEYANWAQKNLSAPEFRSWLTRGRPAPIRFRHTDSPEYLVPLRQNGQVSLDDPVRAPGSIDMDLDPQGRLVFLRVIPNRDTDALPSPIDWNKIFEAAGIEPALWMPVETQEIPPVPFDESKAWTGTYPAPDHTPLRIEAAAWKGRPVYFEIFGPWHPKRSLSVTSAAPSGQQRPAFAAATLAILVSAGVLFAVRNYRAGRGDRSGAFRLGTFVFICYAISGTLILHHTPTAGELSQIFGAFGTSLLIGAVVWTFYMALEPYVRRNWPQVLIGWTRALGGNLRDPVVAGHLLAAIAAGTALAVLFDVEALFQTGLSPVPALETIQIVSDWGDNLAFPPALALGAFFLFLLLKLVLRRTWLAVGAVAVVVGITALLEDAPLAARLGLPLTFAAYIAVSIRFGVLALTAMLIAVRVRVTFPLTPNFSAWYAPQCWITVAIILAISLWCFHSALGGRRVWKGDFFEN